MTEVKKPKTPWWQIAATIVVVAISGAAARTCTEGAVENGQRMLTPQSEVEAQLDQYASTDPFLTSFRDAFPDEWTRFRAETAADAKSSKSLAEVQQGAAMRMRGFLLEHVAWTVAAPASYLIELLSADRAFVDQLASEDPTLCARYGMTGLNGSETISDETRRLLTMVAVKKVAATRAGRDDPQAYGEITTPDAEALVAGMAQAGASDAIIELMLGDATVGTQDQQCAGTRAIYRSMDAMPDDQAARVYATIIRGAAAEQRTQTP